LLVVSVPPRCSIAGGLAESEDVVTDLIWQTVAGVE
jgi:hypothetical protein